MATVSAEGSVAVIGGGVMGLASAVELTVRGYAVEVFEALEVANNRGGSGGTGRIFRLTYPEPEAVRALTKTAALWSRLEACVGESLRSPIGGIDYGDDKLIASFASALARSDVPFELLEQTAAEAIWPGLKLSGRVLFQRDGALIHSERVLAALVAYLQSAQVPVSQQTIISGLTLSADGVELVAGGERRAFAQAVVCAGGGTNALCKGIVKLPPVRITQEFTLTFDCEPAGEPLPIACDYRRPPIPGDSYFWLANAPGRMKVGAFSTGLEIDYANPGSQECPSVLAELLERYARETFTSGAPLENAEIAPCTYDYSPDEWFFAGSGGEGRVIAVGGFSGHGFKFAPCVAEAVANAIASRGAQMPAGLPWSAAAPTA